MREILFRGKDLQEQNGWLYGYFYKSDINKRERESGKATLIFTPNCDTFIYCPEYHNSWMVKAETVGQYTGLTDKNGTKIFENDIVKTKYGRLCEVRWISSPCSQCWDLIPIEATQKAPDSYDVWASKNLEVVGNVHDGGERENGRS